MQKLPRFPEELNLAQSLKSPTSLETYEKLRIGAEIKKIRLKKNITQKKLAFDLGTSQSAVARIENGKQNLSVQMLSRIGLALGKKIHIQFQ